MPVHLFLVLLGFPIAFTLVAIGVAFGYYAYYQGGIETIADLFNNNIFYLLNQNTYSRDGETTPLVAIPLFLFMGYVVERANIVSRLFFSLQLAARNMPGSMAIAATDHLHGVFRPPPASWVPSLRSWVLLAFPAMANASYNKRFASGVICAGGTLGILIPPSIMLIVYSAIAELSPFEAVCGSDVPRVAACRSLHPVRDCAGADQSRDRPEA